MWVRYWIQSLSKTNVGCLQKKSFFFINTYRYIFRFSLIYVFIHIYIFNLIYNIIVVAIFRPIYIPWAMNHLLYTTGGDTTKAKIFIRFGQQKTLFTINIIRTKYLQNNAVRFTFIHSYILRILYTFTVIYMNLKSLICHISLYHTYITIIYSMHIIIEFFHRTTCKISRTQLVLLAKKNLCGSETLYIHTLYDYINAYSVRIFMLYLPIFENE